MAWDDEFGSFSYGEKEMKSGPDKAGAEAHANTNAGNAGYTGSSGNAAGAGNTGSAGIPSFGAYRTTEPVAQQTGTAGGYPGSHQGYPQMTQQSVSPASSMVNPYGYTPSGTANRDPMGTGSYSGYGSGSGSGHTGSGNTPDPGKGSGSKSESVKKSTSSAKTENRKKKGSGTGKKFLLTASLALVFGAVSSGVFIGANKLFGSSDNGGKTGTEISTGNTATSDSIGTQPTVDTSGSTVTVSYDVAEIVKKAQPSIVSITTTVSTSYQYYFQQYERESTGAGSGIIIGKDDTNLYVATNYHVIENAKEINVGFNDGQILRANVTGYDSSADVAVVQIPVSTIPESTAAAISIAVTGDSDTLQVGEPAIAIGNALGYGQSVTVGYISALNRTITANTGTYIQTDAAINPGNSGGALFNAKGEVIGINSVKYVDSKVEGMGFSIPINKAMTIINSLIQKGTVGKIYIGIGGANVTQEYSQIYGFPVGIYVKNVASDTPAEKAGILQADIITAVDGKTVTTMDELVDTLQKYKAGDTVELTLYRADSRGGYNQTSVRVTVEQE